MSLLKPGIFSTRYSIMPHYFVFLLLNRLYNNDTYIAKTSLMNHGNINTNHLGIIIQIFPLVFSFQLKIFHHIKIIHSIVPEC